MEAEDGRLPSMTTRRIVNAVCTGAVCLLFANPSGSLAQKPDEAAGFPSRHFRFIKIGSAPDKRRRRSRDCERCFFSPASAGALSPRKKRAKAATSCLAAASSGAAVRRVGQLCTP